MNFLEQIAVYLHRVYGDQLQNFCIVFPNIRAGLFFRKYLAGLSDKPLWSPAFRSLGSLMEEMTGLTKADNLSMIFGLYKTYREHKPTNETFEEFYFWGEMLLDDFDDIDKHLVNAHDLFRNVSDLKEIDRLFDYLSEEQKTAIRLFWLDFNGGNSGSIKTDFGNIWPLLYPVYESFKKTLKEKSVGYDGMIQRESVQLLKEGNNEYTHYEKYIFIGFNALTDCERYFFKALQKQNCALFFWDYDDYYLNHTWHEAGMFIRDNIRDFPQEYNPDSQQLTDVFKHIEIISVPSDTGQAKLAGQLLQPAPEKTDWIRTAIVLPDEQLLLPVLSSLPAGIADVNITMGYPFIYTPVNSLFENLVSLQLHKRKYADGVRFYHQDVNMILYHPYIQHIIPDESNAVIRSIIEHNRIFVPEREICIHPVLKLIFKECEKARDFISYLSGIALEITGRLKNEENSIPDGANDPAVHNQYQLEYLYTFYTTLQRMGDILTADEIDMELPVFSRLLRKAFASLKIPFSGEPVKGLQVMGMLETRALDFDRVILLSMNEGIYPRASVKQSFIPYNLRKGFGLTTSDRQDAISAYHFYRLIQRAKNVRLIYNSASIERNTGEMSRFLSQLLYEPAFNVHQRNFTFHISLSEDKEIVKERTEEVRKILDAYLSSGKDARFLSPSALNSYLDCRLRFYFRYVDGLTEPGRVNDEIDQSVFGLLLHKTMELLYASYKGKNLDAATLGRIQSDTQLVNQAILTAFAEHFFHTDRITEEDIAGRNIIIREVLFKYLMRILEVDKEQPFTLISLEEQLKVQIPVRSGHDSALLNMIGYIDRLDYVQETLRIIDYKTGRAERNFPDVESLFDREKKDNHAVMQTLVYACMTHLAHPQYERISPRLYVMKDIFKDKEYDARISFSRKQPVENYFDVAPEFEPILNELLSEIFLSDFPFTQTEDLKKCRICLYADICHRKRK